MMDLTLSFLFTAAKIHKDDETNKKKPENFAAIDAIKTFPFLI